MAINNYSTNPDLNTDINGIDLSDATSVPGDMNDAIRQLAADLANTMWGDLSLAVSTDADNAIVMGNDNLLYVAAGNVKDGMPRDLISTDANNVIEPGTDGRLYCESVNSTYDYSNVSNKPASFTPTAHASTHNTGGSDVVTFSIPSGQIWMWYGTIATIPAGWYLCDGTNGTPDLRGKFIMGAASDAQVGATGGGYGIASSNVANKTISLGYTPHVHSMVGWGNGLSGDKTPAAPFSYLSPTETSVKNRLVAGAHYDSDGIGHNYHFKRYLVGGTIYKTLTEAHDALVTTNTHNHTLDNLTNADSIYPPYKCVYYIMKA